MMPLLNAVMLFMEIDFGIHCQKYKLASIGITKPLHLRFDDNSEANLDIPNNNCEGYFISSSVVISEDVYKGGNTTFLKYCNFLSKLT